MEKNSHNAFTSGFVLGIFSGVVGYYLFGTDQGKKTQAKLAKEWAKAYQHLVDEGVLDKKPEYEKLSDFVNSAKETLKEKLDIKDEPAAKTKKSPRKKRTYQRKSKTQQKQFKGV